jgi:transcriptional regulator of met regulon
MTIIGEFIYLGGGGGNEIKNKIEAFRLPDLSVPLPLLQNPVHEESTDK